MVNGEKIENPLNQETVTMRGTIPGEYVVNVNHYVANGVDPVPVTVTVQRVNPRLEVIYYGTVTVDHRGDEKTAVRFTLDAEGNYSGPQRPFRFANAARPPRRQGLRYQSCQSSRSLQLSIAYVVIAVLLLSMNLTSRWRWWIKAGAILVTGVFFAGSYLSIVSILGWPTPDAPPKRFSLLASRVVEPDRVTGNPGMIYLWLEELDENNVPSLQPRSYGLTFTSDFAKAVGMAQDLLANGEEVEGSIQPRTMPDDPDNDRGLPTNDEGQQMGTPFIPTSELDLVFNNMPPVKLPEKAVL